MSDSEWDARCPYGVPGDRLWVREAWAPEQYDASATAIAELEASVRRPAYRADFRGEPAYKWRPSIHMPRKASRILLEVTDVRVERLQDISEADAIAEGIFELVPAANRGEGLTAGALALAATMTVDRMPRASRRSFLRGALAAALGFVASPSRPWEVQPTRWTRAPSPQQVYALLWESINGPGSWDANPWVWAVSFERSKP